MGWDRRVAPADHHGINNDKVLEDGGRMSAAAVGADHTELFTQRARPDRFSRLAIDAGKVAVHAQRIDAACFWIADHAAPADALGRDVGQVDVPAILPQFFAGVGIQADDLFLFLLGVGLVADLRINLAVHHDRARYSGGFLGLPKDVLTGIRVPLVDQAGLTRNAVLFGPSPVWPIHW